MVSLAIFILTCTAAIGQHRQMAYSDTAQGQLKKWKAPIVPLDDSGISYIKFGVGTNIWMRYIENNPGTINSAGHTVNENFDVALRRMRLSVMASLGEKFIVYTQFGVNNQTYVNGGTVTPTAENKKPAIFFHDFWLQRVLWPKKLYAGIGLNAWNGISRLTNVSYGKNFTLDNPTFNFPNIERSDQIGRQIGLFFHGNIMRFNYRFSLAKPFAFEQASSEFTNIATEISSEKPELKGYVFYQFWGQEDFNTSFTSMSYLGKKRLLNIGFGFDHLQSSTVSTSVEGQEIIHNKTQLGLDLFLELPLKRNAVLNVYGVSYLYNFGPNYIRSIGVMNVGKGGFLDGMSLAQGGGNASFSIGTGTINYLSAAYILPSSGDRKGRIQPFAAINIRRFEALDQAAVCEHIGINYLVYGHELKYSLEYSTRPIYAGIPGTSDDNIIADRKGMLIFQVQLLL